jgi:hypothetical protein
VTVTGAKDLVELSLKLGIVKVPQRCSPNVALFAEVGTVPMGRGSSTRTHRQSARPEERRPPPRTKVPEVIGKTDVSETQAEAADPREQREHFSMIR